MFGIILYNFLSVKVLNIFPCKYICDKNVCWINTEVSKYPYWLDTTAGMEWRGRMGDRGAKYKCFYCSQESHSLVAAKYIIIIIQWNKCSNRYMY